MSNKATVTITIPIDVVDAYFDPNDSNWGTSQHDPQAIDNFSTLTIDKGHSISDNAKEVLLLQEGTEYTFLIQFISDSGTPIITPDDPIITFIKLQNSGVTTYSWGDIFISVSLGNANGNTLQLTTNSDPTTPAYDYSQIVNTSTTLPSNQLLRYTISFSYKKDPNSPKRYCRIDPLIKTRTN